MIRPRSLVPASLLAALVLAAPAAAADTTPPTLTAKPQYTYTPSVGRILTSVATGFGYDRYEASTPLISAKSSEAGTIIYVARDSSNRALGRNTRPVAAGQVVDELQYAGARTWASYLFPTTVIPCSPAVTACGERLNLKSGSFYAIDITAYDAAGNKSKTYRLWSIYLGTVRGLAV